MSELHLMRRLPEAGSLPEHTKNLKIQCGSCGWSASYVLDPKNQTRSGQQFAKALSCFQEHNTSDHSNTASWSVAAAD